MTKRIRVLSDLHLEYRTPEQRAELLERITAGPAPNLTVLAGDVAPLGWLATSGAEAAAWLKELTRRRGQVLWILGNHERYGTDVLVEDATVQAALQAVGTYRINVLRRGLYHLGRIRILGTTLYWGEPPAGIPPETMRDYRMVGHLAPWVYEQGAADEAWLRAEVRQGDLVVTHLLPSHRGVSPRYAGQASNHFWVRPMDDLIAAARPALWVAGHTHEAVDAMLGETRLVVNPVGYFGEHQTAPFNPELEVEL